MTSMLFNLSAKPDLQPLAEVVGPLQKEAARLEAPVFLMGEATKQFFQSRIE